MKNDLNADDESGWLRACNSAASPAISRKKWFQVSPFGEFDGGEAGIQFFGKADAKKMVAQFNSVRSKIGRAFRGLPIFIGHPDVDRETYPDDRRRGKVVELQVRNGGLYARAAWNSLGAENLKEEFWAYPSPLWIGPEVPGGFHPHRLLSIGLTNTPRIAESAPLTAVANAKQSADDLGTNQEKNMNREKLIELLGLGADATDDEINAALMELVEKARAGEAPPENTEEMAAANSKIAKLRKQKSRTQKTCANALIKLALVEGRITKAEVPAQESAFKENFKFAANAIESRLPRMNTQPVDVSKTKVDVSDEKQRQVAVANAVSSVMEKTKKGYREAYLQVKNDPNMKPIFDAMKTGEED